jgi:hypothetical protein
MFTKKQKSGIPGPRDHQTSTMNTTTYKVAEKYPSPQVLSVKSLKPDEETEQVKALGKYQRNSQIQYPTFTSIREMRSLKL